MTLNKLKFYFTFIDDFSEKDFVYCIQDDLYSKIVSFGAYSRV